VKEEAQQRTHPREALEKMSQILQHQIENCDDTEVIEVTKEFILEIEDSLRFIEQGQEDTFYYKLIRTNKSLADLKKTNFIINDSDSENENMNMLPPIGHQQFENDGKVSNKIIEFQLKDNSKGNDENMSDGQKTPKSSGSNSSSVNTSNSVNVIQKQLNEALKILSPQEKIMKTKSQAKLNAQKRKQKLEDMKNERKLKSSKSEKKKVNKESTSGTFVIVYSLKYVFY